MNAIRLLLRQEGAAQPTVETLVAAAQNEKYGAHILELLLPLLDADIPEDALIMAASFEDRYCSYSDDHRDVLRRLRILLRHPRAHKSISEQALISTAQREGIGRKALDCLCSSALSGTIVTENILKAAAKHGSVAAITYLLEQDGAEDCISEDVLVAVASS